MDQLINYVTERISKATANVFDTKSKSMVSTRLKRRMIELSIKDPDEYLEFLKSNFEQEEPLLIELLTTHHTFLFREIIHFEFIKQNFDQIINNVKKQGRKTIHIWSAAASTGQEAYSLALFFDHELKSRRESLDFVIHGTDIAPQSIETAKAGIYPYSKLKEIPSQYLEGYWNQTKKGSDDVAQISNNIRSKCDFKTYNLTEKYNSNIDFDIIFCRNVLIYFDDATIKSVVENLYSKLAPHGLLFTGVSEPIGQYSDEVQKVGPCIYKRQVDLNSESEAEKTVEFKQELIKVLNVDDSPAVLKIMKKIFDEDPRYKIVGQCKDGLELEKYLSSPSEKPDIITLDLHMPNLDGVGYLERNFKEGHPPVVIVSSVNRENLELAKKAVTLGAIDYVEKPNFQNFADCSEEIKNKIVSYLSLSDKPKTPLARPSASQTPSKPALAAAPKKVSAVKKAHLTLFCSKTSLSKVETLLKELIPNGYIPSDIIVPTNDVILEFKEKIKSFFSQYGIESSVDSINFQKNLDYYINAKSRLARPNQILCFYSGNESLEHTKDYIALGTYILAEKSFQTPHLVVDSMPSTSWGYHILDEIKNKKVVPNTLYSWNDFKDKILPLSQKNALVVFYSGRIPKHFIEISNFDKVKPILNEFSKEHPDLNSYKIAAPLSLGKKIKAIFDDLHLKALNLFQTSREAQYKFRGNDLMIKHSTKNKSKTVVTTTSKRTRSRATRSPEPLFRSSSKIKVMVIDDSPTLTKIIEKYFQQDSSIDCISIHHNIKDLDKSIRELKPDIITLDMNMPDMTGDQVYECIIKKHNIPTILLTSSDKNSKAVIYALDKGIWDYIQKPALKEMTIHKFPLIQKIKEAHQNYHKQDTFSESSVRLTAGPIPENSLILIGASTGGTRAISYVLSNFPRTIPPVIIGQHIPAGYSTSFAELLNEKNPFNVREAVDGEVIKPNTVYIAPGSLHSSIVEKNGQLIIKTTDSVPGASFTPSIDHLFKSASKIRNKEIVATILTGMGKDGSLGLMDLKNQGAMTLSQDEKTSIVYGMPKAAIKSGASQKQVSLNDMAGELFSALKNLVKKAS